MWAEGYPVEPKSDADIPAAFAWTGLPKAFVHAGFKEVARRSPTLIDHPLLGSKLAYTLRWTLNLDDRSARATGILEFGFNDRLELFAIGNLYTGYGESEFGSLLSEDVMLGLEYTF